MIRVEKNNIHIEQKYFQRNEFFGKNGTLFLKHQKIIGTKNIKAHCLNFLHMLMLDGHQYHVRKVCLTLCHVYSSEVVAACRKIAKCHRKTKRQNITLSQSF